MKDYDCNKCHGSLFSDYDVEWLIVENGPHLELVCRYCGAYKKFVSQEEAQKLIESDIALADNSELLEDHNG